MKMAKPTASDIEAGFDLLGVLTAIDSRWGGPWATTGPSDLNALDCDFDADKPEHLQALYNHLAKLLRRAPGFPGRVLGGMCAVICYERNMFLDPALDYLQLHPDLIAGLQLLEAKRADFISSLERQARAVVAETVESAAARHLAEMCAAAEQGAAA
ncbi:hypothetical protein [Acidovorax lacteus]|uniref:Uncharacterized protein n=1 Tax=Acidovorax lacteus TaxID=1924988 RepID=A0ABP8L804_9BURK